MQPGTENEPSEETPSRTRITLTLPSALRALTAIGALPARRKPGDKLKRFAKLVQKYRSEETSPMQYIAFVRRDGKRWLGEFPDCPGCQTFGSSLAELRAQLADALTGWLEAHMVTGRVPPRPRRHALKKSTPRRIAVAVPAALSVALLARWACADVGNVKHAVRRTKTSVAAVAGKSATLRLLRLALRKTQSEVSRGAEIAQGEVSAIENSDLGPRQVATLARYVRALGGRLEISVVFNDGERIVVESPHVAVTRQKRRKKFREVHDRVVARHAEAFRGLASDEAADKATDKATEHKRRVRAAVDRVAVKHAKALRRLTK